MQCPSPGPFAGTVWLYGICCTGGGWHYRAVYHMTPHLVTDVLLLLAWLRRGLRVMRMRAMVTAPVSQAGARRRMTGTWVCQAAPTALRPMAASGMYPLGLTAPMDRRHPRWSPGARGVSPRPRDRTFGSALRDAHGTWYHILLSAALKEGKRSAAVDGQININSSFIIVNSIIMIILVAVAIPS